MNDGENKSDILQTDYSKWRLVIEATYGLESPVSCEMVQGTLTLIGRPRPYSSPVIYRVSLTRDACIRRQQRAGERGRLVRIVHQCVHPNCPKKYYPIRSNI